MIELQSRTRAPAFATRSQTAVSVSLWKKSVSIGLPRRSEAKAVVHLWLNFGALVSWWFKIPERQINPCRQINSKSDQKPTETDRKMKSAVDLGCEGRGNTRTCSGRVPLCLCVSACHVYHVLRGFTWWQIPPLHPFVFSLLFQSYSQPLCHPQKPPAPLFLRPCLKRET